MPQTSEAIEHREVAKGVAALPLGVSTGQWQNSLNFRMWKKRVETVKRKLTFNTLVPSNRTLDIPTSQSCLIRVGSTTPGGEFGNTPQSYTASCPGSQIGIPVTVTIAANSLVGF